MTEVNVNLQNQMGQIEFHNLSAKTFIYNNHYNEDTDDTPEKTQTVGYQPLSCHNPHLQNLFRNMNCHHKQQLSTTQVHNMQEKATYL